MAKVKKSRKKFWALKVFIITIILAAGISLATEWLTDRISTVATILMLLGIMLIGVVFDIVGIAFASCDQAPFISMASRKIKRAKSAIKLLQNADIVTNICADVIGDVCGIVSGAIGAAIAIKISADSNTFVWGIVMSSLIAAITVSGRAFGKTVGLKKNKEIVSTVSYLLMFIIRDKKVNKNGGKKEDRRLPV